MKTIQISTEEMQKRHRRYRELQPLPIQNPSIPEKARDVVYSRKLLSVIGLDTKADTPINVGAPIVGAVGMTMTLAVCPPGQGPASVPHRNTYETFTVMKGRFSALERRRVWSRVELYDTISFPPGVCRSFRNISEDEGILQVIITGGVQRQRHRFRAGGEAPDRGGAAGVEFETALPLPPGADPARLRRSRRRRAAVRAARFRFRSSGR